MQGGAWRRVTDSASPFLLHVPEDTEVGDTRMLRTPCLPRVQGWGGGATRGRGCARLWGRRPGVSDPRGPKHVQAPCSQNAPV